MPVATVWGEYWREGEGYASFLRNMSDFDISIDEWASPSHDGSPVPCPEDKSSLRFVAKRSCEYKHPRTSMLMFGPKNAPAKQIQYLFLQGEIVSHFTRGLHRSRARNSDKDTNHDDHARLSSSMSGLVLTVTQFDSIPMADVFKVLQYWAFEPSPDAPSTHTVVRVGFALHQVKPVPLSDMVWDP